MKPFLYTVATTAKLKTLSMSYLAPSAAYNMLVNPAILSMSASGTIFQI